MEEVEAQVKRAYFLYKDLEVPEEYMRAFATPLKPGMTEAEKRDIAFNVLRAQSKGLEHMLWEDYQREFGGEQGMSANVFMQQLRVFRENDVSNTLTKAHFVNQISLCHPDDCLRIAEKHVQKQPHFNIAFYSSVISTTSDEHWKHQRDTLTPAFLPHQLAKVFPISSDRATVAANKLKDTADTSLERVVNMNEFLLFEAKAQLRLAMFGDSQEDMETINQEYRTWMDGTHKANGMPLIKLMRNNISSGKSSGPLSAAIDRLEKCPFSFSKAPTVNGPHTVNPENMPNLAKATTIGNLQIFSFAGHDTTGHTMSWLCYELSNNLPVQRRLQAEVDNLWSKVASEGRSFEYKDFFELPFMTRCIMETLRLWPAVGNGTYRILQERDWVTGKDGQKVWLEAGTLVQVTSWSRHRNKALWGEDACVFNPDREFRDGELWEGQVFSGKNPHSERFSPFTFPPRDCIGKNFSQMEMRLIFLNLLRKFTFLPAPASAGGGKQTAGVNYGTLGPQDLASEGFYKRRASSQSAVNARRVTGLRLKVIERETE